VSDLEADIIVIGGGSAGAAMAGRLSQDGRFSVLLLEAGRSDRHPFTRIPAANINAVQNPAFDWRHQAEPDDTIGGRAEVWPAAKVLGGGSAINGMMFIRGHRWDYDHWAELGARGWDYRSVLPYFRRLETNERGGDQYRGTEGPQHVSEVRANYSLTDTWIRAAVEAGIPRSPDLNGADAEGVDRVQVSQRNGWRHSSATAYLSNAAKRKSLRIELKAEVTRILIDGNRAVGVLVDRAGTIMQVKAQRGVVLSAGTINSARLLLLSGIGPADELAALGIELRCDLPGVGRNLQDHVGTHVAMAVSPSTLNVETSGLKGLAHMANFFLRGRGALTTPIGHAQAFIRTRQGLAAPNVQLSFAPLAFGHDADGRIELLKEPAVSTMIGVMRPKSRGSVTLRSADFRDRALIRYRQLADEDDAAQLIEGIGVARNIFRQPSFAGLIKREIAPGPAAPLRDYLHHAAISLYHQVGTCRMGNDSDAVVDKDLRVRGIDGLWVADASVMPSLPAGNTNATAIMIGDKGADHVIKTMGL
jgi:choline dehydrogenase-like flavoprotein